MGERLLRLTGPHRVLALSLLVGVLAGAAVAALEQVVGLWLLDRTLRLPGWPRGLVPAVGLVVAWAALRWLGRGASPATADEYLHSYHDLDGAVVADVAPAKLVATAATLGSGASLGFEGPAIYLGSLVGGIVGHRMRRLIGPGDRRTLLVAGAAAGVAAIFKTPATGAVFALEVPYHDDTASHAIGPAIIGAAAGYVTFAVFFGFGRLFPIAGSAPIGVDHLLGAVGLGLAAGLGARGFAHCVRWAKSINARVAPSVRIGVAGAVLAGLSWLTWSVFDAPLSMGTGASAILWASAPGRAVGLLVLLVVVRLVGTTVSLGGGGAGGVFIPLFAEGWLLGAILAVLLHDQSLLYPAIGAAAFLGAGYRVPIAAVVFVAESTGRPGFIVPALVATAVAMLAMGSWSVTPFQRRMRLDRIDRLMEEPVGGAADPVTPCAVGDRVADVVESGRPVALCAGGRFVRVLDPVVLRAALAADPDARVPGDAAPDPTAGEPLPPEATLGAARARLTGEGAVALVPVCADGRCLGVVSAASILARTRPPDDD